MSLDWSITDIKDWEQVSMDHEKNGVEAHKTHALVMATMSVDLPGITKKNVDEFYWRIKTTEKLTGALLRRHVPDESLPSGWRIEELHFTREDIERRIGLSTNVSTKPRVAWVARVVKNLLRENDQLDGPALKRELLASAPKKAEKAVSK